MNLREWLNSKKLKTLVTTIGTLIGGHYLGWPAELLQEIMALGLAAIGGFAVQDYAKARDARSNMIAKALEAFNASKKPSEVDTEEK